MASLLPAARHVHQYFSRVKRLGKRALLDTRMHFVAEGRFDKLEAKTTCGSKNILGMLSNTSTTFYLQLFIFQYRDYSHYWFNFLVDF